VHSAYACRLPDAYGDRGEPHTDADANTVAE
jgi:hypothetical protein